MIVYMCILDNVFAECVKVKVIGAHLALKTIVIFCNLAVRGSLRLLLSESLTFPALKNTGVVGID